MTEIKSLPGALFILLALSIILTYIISRIIISNYKNAVIKSMNKTSVENWSKINNNLQGFAHSGSSILKSNSFRDFKWIKSSLKILLKQYIAGGILYSLVVSGAWLISSQNLNFSTFSLFFITYLWPLVITFHLINPLNAKKYFWSYIILFAALALYAANRSPEVKFAQLILLWLINNGILTIIVFSLFNRKIRAIGPLVFAFMSIVIIGAYAIIDVIVRSEILLFITSFFGSALGLGAGMMIIIFIMFGILIFSPVGKRVLRWIGQKYKMKKFSSQSLNLNSMWIIFAVFHSFNLIFFEDFKFILTPIIAFGFFRLGIWIVKITGKNPDRNNLRNRTLLLLRVFSLGRRSEQLYDSITTYWLRQGGICMISGPDLATSTIEPHEFYDYIGGNLSRYFINSEEELNQKISDIDYKPDPDGNYRVNDFFCKTDSWFITMQKLAQICDKIIMDLRSFSENNKGCIDELKHLLKSIPINQVVLITDGTTNISFLNSSVKKIFKDAPDSSPNKTKTKDDLIIYNLTRRNKKETEKLIELLTDYQ